MEGQGDLGQPLSQSKSLKPFSSALEAKAEQIISDLKSLLDILFKNGIPGPKLIRLERESCNPLGHGGQGNVFGASPEFERRALDIPGFDIDPRVKSSALQWIRCVVKHLRTDQRRNDVQHAYREISRLCHPILRRHPNVVKLISWGMSLDGLETASLNSLSTPLLILERAHCDLAQFIRSEVYGTVQYETLLDLCFDVGRGLEAVHSAGIVHGDLKLENVLLFTTKTPTKDRWIAKLCDFGSATATSTDPPEARRYLGSETWLPPECYEKMILGKPMPESLVPCDVFAYGLIVWATFIGIHFSPLFNLQKKEGHGADIVRNIGQQRFYARALKSVTAKFIANNSNIHMLIAELTERLLSQFGGVEERKSNKMKQDSQVPAINPVQGDSKLRAPGNNLRRILLVLRCSLNDSPQYRDLQPWRYLDITRFPQIPSIADPQKFKPAYEFDDRARATNHVAQTRNLDMQSSKSGLHVDLRAFQRRLALVLQQAPHASRRWLTVINHDYGQIGSASIRLLRSSSHRQRLYESYLQEAARQRPSLQELGNFDYLEHRPREAHFKLQPWLRDRLFVTSNSDLIYVYARLRAHVKLCCWKEDMETSSISHEMKSYFENSITTLFPRPEVPDIATLAWLCRGEIGQHELQELESSQDPRPPQWRFLSNDSISVFAMTDAVLLLFENGCDIHRLLEHGLGTGRSSIKRIGTVFAQYLRNLHEAPKVGKDRYMPQEALRVAVHFKRIAMDETSTPLKRYYLTGRAFDATKAVDIEHLFSTTFTTALHDAIRACNYPLVEYLVQLGFNVSAQDSEKTMAIDARPDQGIDPASYNSIIALLRQRQEKPGAHGLSVHRRHKKNATPLGWTQAHTESGSGSSLDIWQETSIESEFDPISFIAPQTGLYESDRLVLGRIQGQDQVYRLDPFRFLKTSDDQRSKYKSGTRATFGDEWYEEDIRKVAEPLPFYPFEDRRAWIQYPARGWFHLRSIYPNMALAFILFAILTLLTRCMDWKQLELPFSIIAIGFYSYLAAFTIYPFNVPRARHKFCYNMLSNGVPELFIGFSAVARGETAFIKSALLGLVLCDALWTLGLALLAGGIHYKEYIFPTTGSSSMTNLGILGPVLASILLLLRLTPNQPDSRETMDNVVFLSRGTAIVSLLLWTSFLWFRLHTHEDLFEEDEFNEDESNEDESGMASILPDLPPFQILIRVVTCLVLLGFCSDILVCSAQQQPRLVQMILGFFIVPQVARLWNQNTAIRFGWFQSPDAAIEATIGVTLTTTFFVAPCLILLGWIVKTPMTFQFSLLETILYALAMWVVSYQLRDGRADYLKGFVLLVLYVMAALALGLSF
ncbi:MAG: hypothetical protein Q9222_004546 [Ikaeria aurantiellina]